MKRTIVLKNFFKIVFPIKGPIKALLILMMPKYISSQRVQCFSICYKSILSQSALFSDDKELILSVGTCVPSAAIMPMQCWQQFILLQLIQVV